MRSSILCGTALVTALLASGCNGDKSAAPTPPAASAPSPTPAAATASAPASASARPEPRIVGASQILVTWKGAELAPPAVTRSQAEAKKRADEALAKIRDGSMTFEEAAKTYSDDEGSKKIGGAIGNFERYAMPKAYGDAAWALEVGETSGVVETPRGFYVIKRTH